MLRKHRMFGPLIVAALLALVLAACGSSEGGTDGGSADTTESTAETTEASSGSVEGKKVIVSTCTNANAWCSRFAEDLKKVLEPEGVDLTILTHEFDAATQTQNLNQAINQKPDVLVVHETADAQSIVPVVQKAAEEGIPTVNVDSRAVPEAEEYFTTQVLFDHGKLGEYAAQNIVEGLERIGKTEGKVIAITGTKSMLNTQDRMEAFHEYMKDYPQYEIVAEEDGNWDPVLTGQIARQLFAKFQGQGGIDAAFGMADYQAIPIIEAAKQAGIPVGVENDGLIVTASNCFAMGRDAIRAGDQYGTATEDPPTAAKWTGETVLKMLRGEEVEPIVDVPVGRVTVDNVDEYEEECSA